MANDGRSLYGANDHFRFRNVPQKRDDGRNTFRRDLSRLIHCSGFRRLQGKMQLFPCDESDFFRNRLTHSLEVAQIASGIATNLNATDAFFKRRRLDEALLTFAGLAHDIGHPPFGHNGERALNEQMFRFGGFEGNAQTLRILTRLQKKETDTFPTDSKVPQMFAPTDQENAGADLRAGLNLAARTLASVIKYDKEIPQASEKPDGQGDDRHKLSKGYYSSEKEIVNTIKQKVVGGPLAKGEKFKTVECCIMDIADDIAYSTYDFEDALKAGFCSPLSAIAITDNIKASIASDISKKLSDEYGIGDMKPDDVTNILFTLFEEIFAVTEPATMEGLAGSERKASQFAASISIKSFSRSHALADNGYLRAEFTSNLVHQMMSGIEVIPNTRVPALTQVRFTIQTFKVVEILKRITRESVIQQHRLKMTERGGNQIVRTIFKALMEERQGRQLLPDDWKEAYFSSSDTAHRHRVVCDFISGMTDRYCLEFYKRLEGVNAPSFFKP